MTEMQNNVAIVKEQYARFFRGDVNAFFGSLAPDVVLWQAESLPYGGTHKGIDAFKAAVNLIVETWAEFSVDVDEYLTGDQTVIALGTFRGTSRKTGRKVSVPLCEAWQVKGGLITLMKPVYADTALMLKAISS